MKSSKVLNNTVIKTEIRKNQEEQEINFWLHYLFSLLFLKFANIWFKLMQLIVEVKGIVYISAKSGH